MSPHTRLQAPVTLTRSMEDRGQNFNMGTKKKRKEKSKNERKKKMNKTNDIACLRGEGKKIQTNTFHASMTPLHHATTSNTHHVCLRLLDPLGTAGL